MLQFYTICGDIHTTNHELVMRTDMYESVKVNY